MKILVLEPLCKTCEKKINGTAMEHPSQGTLEAHINSGEGDLQCRRQRQNYSDDIFTFCSKTTKGKRVTKSSLRFGEKRIQDTARDPHESESKQIKSCLKRMLEKDDKTRETTCQ